MQGRFHRKTLSMTSLIDVIFLLLMFFMLATSFSRTTELSLTARQGGGAGNADPKILFLQLTAESADLNGTPVADEDLPARIADLGGAAPKVLVAMGPELKSQRLMETLARLGEVPGIALEVLE